MIIAASLSGIPNVQAMAEAYRKATLRALKRVSRSAETFANREIRATYNLKRSQVDPYLSSRVVSTSKLQAALNIRGTRLPLMLFTPRQTSRGVYVTVKRGSPRHVKSAFIAQMASGHRGVFKRTGERRRMMRGRYKGLMREPIKELRTISLAEMFSNREVAHKIERFFRDKFPEVLQHETRYYLSQLTK